ncbi:MAG: hypothetical protein GX262_05970 [Clostridia bacterium]|nr:hypothetical protein [Clostridia bacterium]
MNILFVLFMTDFFLTYLGIDAGIIEEANPFMVWLFEIPFLPSLLIRLLMAAAVIYLPIRLIKAQKIRPVLAKTYYVIAYGANAIILGVHLYWIISYGMMIA